MSLDSSHTAFARAQRSIGGGVSSGLRAAMQPHPLFVQRAQGAYVWDLDDDRYIDYVMAWGPLVLGHSQPAVIDAVGDVLSRMQLVGMGHPLEYEAAEAVLAAVPHAERLLWTNSGTEAVQVALRLARAATGRSRVVKFTKAYHGWHDSVYASLTDNDTGEKAVPASRGQTAASTADLVIAQFNDLAGVQRLLRDAASRDIAAVLIDPIMSNAGVTAPAPGFLESIRQLCDQHSVVLVFDEVITGFRIARGGAAERFGVSPDLSVFGKAIAGGFTHSAVAGRAALIDQVTNGVTHAGTYNGNPVALAAVKATMSSMAEPGLYDALEQTSSYFEVAIGDVLRRRGAPAALRRIGSLLQFVPFTASTGLLGTGGLWQTITRHMASEGVVFMPSGKIFLSTAHTLADIDETAAALDRVLRKAI